MAIVQQGSLGNFKRKAKHRNNQTNRNHTKNNPAVIIYVVLASTSLSWGRASLCHAQIRTSWWALVLQSSLISLLLRGAVKRALTVADWTSIFSPAAWKTNQADARSGGAPQGYPSVLLSWCQGLAPCLWIQQVNPLVLLCCSADEVHLEQAWTRWCPIKEAAV